MVMAAVAVIASLISGSEMLRRAKACRDQAAVCARAVGYLRNEAIPFDKQNLAWAKQQLTRAEENLSQPSPASEALEARDPDNVLQAQKRAAEAGVRWSTQLVEKWENDHRSHVAQAEYIAKLRRKYESAADRPGLALEPDPPMPY
jgi:hypothetical protein